MTGLVPNARSHLIEASATLAISATAAKLKAAGLDVVSLGAGEPDFPTPEPIARLASKPSSRATIATRPQLARRPYVKQAPNG